MSSDHKEEIQVEVQDLEAQIDDINDGEESVEMEGDETTKPEPKKQERKEPRAVDKAVELVREPGRSLLPFARVQKIIKADKEIPIVAKEATFLISFATEEFIKHFCQAAYHVAQKDKRSTIHHRDIAAVVRKADEFLFLEEVMLWLSTNFEPPKRRKPKAFALGAALKPSDDDGDEDIVVNTDGTMEARI